MRKTISCMELTELVKVGIRRHKEDLTIVRSLLVVFVSSADGGDVAVAVQDCLFHCSILGVVVKDVMILIAIEEL